MGRGHKPSDDHPWKNSPIKKKMPKDLEDYYAVFSTKRKKRIKRKRRANVIEINNMEMI